MIIANVERVQSCGGGGGGERLIYATVGAFSERSLDTITEKCSATLRASRAQRRALEARLFISEAINYLQAIVFNLKHLHNWPFRVAF